MIKARPLVSVIITTRNSDQTLTELLLSLSTQSYQKCELIIVDNKSIDQTVRIAKKFTKKVFQKGPERSVQRNFGAKKAVGEYLLFLDSDMVLTKNVISECVAKFYQLKQKTSSVRERVNASTITALAVKLRRCHGRQPVELHQKNSSKIGGVVVPEISFGEGFWAKTKALEREINLGESYFEAARFFPKKIFTEFGGYDVDLTGPEDWDLPQRIARKYKISRIKVPIYHNEGRPSFLRFAKKKYYYAKSVHKFLTKQGYSVLSAKTVYFFRPAFYRHWRKLLRQPIVSLGMIIMLIVELIYGGIGYLEGRLKSDTN